jgi:hypothetical protein
VERQKNRQKQNKKNIYWKVSGQDWLYLFAWLCLFTWLYFLALLIYLALLIKPS